MLLAALFAASAGLRTASACHPTLQAAERITEFLEGSGEGSGEGIGEGSGQEESGEYAWLEMMMTGGVLLQYFYIEHHAM